MNAPDNIIVLDTRRKQVTIEPLVYSPAHVAQILGISDRQVRIMCETGELIAFKIGRIWRIHRDDLQAYLDARRGRS